MGEFTDYFDIVLCEDETTGSLRLYAAPGWSHLKAGEVVVSESGKVVTVIMSHVLSRKTDDDREVLDMLMRLSQQKKLKRLTSKIVTEKLNYREERENA